MIKQLIAIIIGLIILPTTTLATFTVPFTATSTTQGWVMPNLVNGIFQTILGNTFIASSTSATSTLPNLQISRLNFNGDYLTDITGPGIGIVNGALSATGTIKVINVKDAPFNAVGDGVTDDTVALAAAYAVQQNASTTACMYLPPGEYLTSVGFNGTEKQCIIGAWSGMNSQRTDPYKFVSRVIMTTNNTPIITVDSDGDRLENFGVKYQTRQGLSDTNAKALLFQSGATRGRFRNLAFENVGWGMYTSGGESWQHDISNIHVLGYSQGCVYFNTSATSVTINQFYCQNGGNPTIDLLPVATSPTKVGDVITITADPTGWQKGMIVKLLAFAPDYINYDYVLLSTTTTTMLLQATSSDPLPTFTDSSGYAAMTANVAVCPAVYLKGKYNVTGLDVEHVRCQGDRLIELNYGDVNFTDIHLEAIYGQSSTFKYLYSGDNSSGNVGTLQFINAGCVEGQVCSIGYNSSATSELTIGNVVTRDYSQQGATANTGLRYATKGAGAPDVVINTYNEITSNRSGINTYPGNADNASTYMTTKFSTTTRNGIASTTNMIIDGSLKIGTTTAPSAPLTIGTTTGNALVRLGRTGIAWLDIGFGGAVTSFISNTLFNFTSSLNDATNKQTVFGFGHYSSSEESACIAAGNVSSGFNILGIGGGASNCNAVTSLSLYTAADSTTTTGTERLKITSAGLVGIGTTTPYAKLSVVGPVVAEYFHATSTTATSTFTGIRANCFSTNGTTCITGSGGSSSSSTILVDNNTFSGNNNFTGATTSLKGYGLATSTVVCKPGQNCQFNTIQAAINAGATNILVKDGVYSEQVTFANAKTIIRGESLNAIIQCNGSTQSPCVSTNATNEFHIDNITIRETNANVLGIAINFSDSAQGKITNSRINNFATSTYAHDTTNNTFYNRIDNNTFFNVGTCIDLGGTQPNANSSSENRCRPMSTGGFGIYLEDTRGFTSVSDDFEATSTAGNTIGVFVASTSRENTFINPWIEAHGTGVSTAAGSNRTSFVGGSITSNGTDITDNGTNTTFLNSSDTGVLFNQLSPFTVPNTTGTSSITNALQLGSTAGNNMLKITPSNSYSASISTGGAINLTNTSNTGAGIIVYDNQGATASGRLLALTADNPAFDQQVLFADQDGTSGAGVFNCDLTTGNALECMTVSSLKQDKTAMGITGQEIGLGTLKVTHDYPGVSDANASALSLRANGVGTAAQGIFFDAEDGTTGKMMNFRNSGIELFTLTSGGSLGLGTTSPYTRLGVVGEIVTSNITATTTATNTLPILLTTNATSTNFFSTTASSTNLYTSNLSVGTTSQTAPVTIGTNSGNPFFIAQRTGSTRLQMSFAGAQVGFESISPFVFSPNFNNGENKTTTLGFNGYNATDGPTCFALGSNDSMNAEINWGGLGTDSACNPVTLQRFYTATTSTSTAGTLAGIIGSTGTWTLGSGAEGTSRLTVKGNVFTHGIETASSFVGTSTATSTFAGGITSPCFSNDGTTCITSGGGTASSDSKWSTSTDTVSIYPTAATKVGIGTTTPRVQLEVATSTISTTGDLIRLTNTAAIANARPGLAWRDSSATGNFSSARLSSKIGTSRADSAFYIEVADSGQTLRDRLTIDVDGDIGIGTTSPYAKLSVVGQTVSEYFTATSTTATSTFPKLTSTYIQIGNDTINDVTGSGILNVGGALTLDTSGLWATTSANYNFGVNLSATTTLPNLNVLTGLATIGSSTGTTTFAGGLSVGNNAALVVNQAATANSLYINSSGNVGVGIASPTNKLQVAGTLYVSSTITSASSVAGSAGLFTYHGPLGDNDIIFRDFNALEWMRIQKATGNVGIGTTSPLAKLDVLNIAGGTTPLFSIASSTNGAATSTAFYVAANGNVGVGTTSPSGAFSSQGTVFMNGLTTSTAGNAVCQLTGGQIVNAGNTTCLTSSKRFKTDIEDIDVGLKEVLAMKPRSYTRTQPTPSMPSGKEVGLIAEEVNEIVPRLVEYEADGVTPRGVNYQEYTAVLTKAIQELDEKIGGGVATAKKSATDNWQWFVIGLLALGLGYQQYQIKKLKK